MPVTIMGELRFPPEAIESILPHLKSLVETTRSEDGCLAYFATQDPLAPGSIRFSELWTDLASVEAHLGAPHIAPWREACGRHGVYGRQFTAYEVTGERSL